MRIRIPKDTPVFFPISLIFIKNKEHHHLINDARIDVSNIGKKRKNRKLKEKKIDKYVSFLEGNFKQWINNEELVSLSKKSGFVERSSKLDGPKFLEMLMFGNRKGSASLNDLSAYLLEEYNINISKQSVDERFNKQAVNYLKEILTKQISATIHNKNDDGILNEVFNRVLIKDSTRYSLPDKYSEKYEGHCGCTANSKSMISIQFEYDHLSGSILDLSLTSGRRNDQKDAREKLDHITKGDLRISDLGYATMPYMVKIAKQEAYFLNRLNPQCGAYEIETGEDVDFGSIYKRLKKHNLLYIEKDILIGQQYKLPCRIIISMVPDKVYEKRIKAANKRNKSKSIPNDYKVKAHLNIFVTNVEVKKLMAQQVIDLYKIRWQIELIFKVWKSLGKINIINNCKIDRFECQLLGKLIWLLAGWRILNILNKWMYDEYDLWCSPWKFYKQLLEYSKSFKKALIHGEQVGKWIIKLMHKAKNNMIKETRKYRIPYQQLWDLITCPNS